MCCGNQNPAKYHQELSDEKSTSRISSRLSNVYTALKELKKKKKIVKDVSDLARLY